MQNEEMNELTNLVILLLLFIIWKKKYFQIYWHLRVPKDQLDKIKYPLKSLSHQVNLYQDHQNLTFQTKVQIKNQQGIFQGVTYRHWKVFEKVEHEPFQGKVWKIPIGHNENCSIEKLSGKIRSQPKHINGASFHSFI